MKKPPDVIVLNTRQENPIDKWIFLAQWAFDNNDKYLSDRAHEMILRLCQKH